MNLNFDEIIKSYFNRENILVKHQLDSYDEYIDKILPNIISNYFPIELDFDSDKIKNIKLNIIKINIGKPFTTENNGCSKVLTPETAHQVTSLLEGVIKRGTGRKLRNLNLPLAGKTGTTNNNMDAWFIGFTSNFVVGVYVGFDEPKTLGKYETGAKAALPIFKKIIKRNVKKGEALPFKIPQSINIVIVDYDSGKPVNIINKRSIYESFKAKNSTEVDLENSININTLGAYRTSINKKILRLY